MIDDILEQYLTEANLDNVRWEIEENAGRSKSGGWTVVEKFDGKFFKSAKAHLEEKRELNPDWEYRLVKYTTNRMIMGT